MSTASCTTVVVDVYGEFVYASLPQAGSFSCGNPLFNSIHEIVLESMKSNLGPGVWMDCPHREKLGWLEVAHLMGPSIAYNFDARLLFSKVVQDMADAQLVESGLVPDIVPEYTVFAGGFRDSPGTYSTLHLTPPHSILR
jgi:hypothetical protein